MDFSYWVIIFWPYFLGLLLLLPLYLCSRIIRKAGFSRWWVLTLLIPGVNLLMLAVFALIPWPYEKC